MSSVSQKPTEHTSRYYQSITEFAQKPKTTIYTGAIFSFLAVSLFGWYAIRPTLQTILFLRREIADNKIVSKQMEEKISKLIEAHAVYQTMVPRLPYLAQALSDDPQAVYAVAQLKALTTQAGASVSAIMVAPVPLVAISEKSPIDEKVPSTNKVLPTKKDVFTVITMVATGTYDALMATLTGIVNLRRIFVVDTITFTPDKSPAGQVPTSDVQLRMVVRLQAHYLK